MKKPSKHILKKLSYFSVKKEIILIIVAGLFLRLFLADGPYNFDMTTWINTGAVMRHHLDIYAYDKFYNYPPLWFFVLGFLDRISLIFPIIPFRFIERAFLSLVDVATFFLIYFIAKKRKLPPLKTASLFYLNPISIIISGHHGQYDNVAIFFLLSALYYFQKNNITTKVKSKFIFIFLTLALLAKHIIIFQVLYFFRLYKKNLISALVLFGLCVGIFLLTLLPFVSSSGGQILRRVFLYGGVQGLYGFTYFLGNIIGRDFSIFGIDLYDVYKLLFLTSYLLFLLMFHSKDIARGILISILFFLVFTSGIGAQYFILPIAFGVFFPTRWFYLYTIATTLFFLGSVDELNIYTFKVFEWNTVWLAAILWFLAEFAIVFKPLAKLRQHLLTS